MMLTEGAVMIALAQILSYITIYRLPQGGSIDIGMLPIVIFAVRHGAGFGALAGAVYGVLQYLLGNGFAIDWTTIVMDYLAAFALLGLAAGFFRFTRRGLALGCVAGSLARFAAHYLVGAVIWAKWMPDEFFGMTMTSPWFYSLLYNGSYMLADMILITVIGLIIYKPLSRIKLP